MIPNHRQRLFNYQGELKNPFENKNKHIRIKGPTPNTKRTIFAFLGVVFPSSFTSIIVEVIFFLDFLLGISKINFVIIIAVINYEGNHIRKSNLIHHCIHYIDLNNNNTKTRVTLNLK